MIDGHAWPDGVGPRWLQALRLPTLDWLRPLVSMLGLPEAIAARPDVLPPIHEQAAADRQELIDATASVGEVEGLDGAITREVVVKALHRLADAVGRDDARAFERWARIFVVSDRIVADLFNLRLVLLRYLRTGTAESDPPPPALEAHRDVIEPILSNERGERLNEELAAHAPPPGDYERELGLPLASDALEVKEIVWNRWTLEALVALGGALDEPERAEVASWASRQVTAMSEGERPVQPSAYLRYLPPDDLTAGIPSALDLPFPRADGSVDPEAFARARRALGDDATGGGAA